jgi:hypothetical protein
MMDTPEKVTTSTESKEQIFKSDISSAFDSEVTPSSYIIPSEPETPLITINQINLKTASQKVTCPTCTKEIITEVNTKLNTCNTLFCIFGLYIPWLVLKCLKRKDFNCLDAEHICPNCGNILAHYNAC